jgi:hypothetical protein
MLVRGKDLNLFAGVNWTPLLGPRELGFKV